MKSTQRTSRVNSSLVHGFNNNHSHKLGVWIFTAIGLATAAWLWVSLLLS